MSLLLIGVGSLLKTQTGLICTDWPICYAKVSTHFSYEQIHRYLALALIFLSLIAGLKSKHRLSWLPFIIIVFQALIGGLVFYFKLATLFTLFHLAAAYGVLFVCLKLYFELSSQLFKFESFSRHSKDFLCLGIVFVMIQSLLGALLSKAGASEVCYEFWTCLRGEWDARVLLNLSHKFFGFFIGIYYFFVSFKVSSQRLSFLPFIFVVFQIFSGVLGQYVLGNQGLKVFHLLNSAAVMGISYYFFLVQKKDDPTPGFLEDFFLLTKLRLVALVAITVLIGVLMAPFKLPFLYLVITSFGIVLLGMGACAYNCILEKDIDLLMERTRQRPLPAKRMRVGTAHIISFMITSLGVTLTYWGSNLLTVILGLIALGLYLFLYTPLKARTPFALYIGAIPGALPPLMGWTAVTNSINGLGLFLFLFLVLWQLPHFMSIAIYRYEDYLNAGLKTYVQTHGIRYARNFIILFTGIMTLFSFFVLIDKEDALYYLVILLLNGLFFGISLRGLFLPTSIEKLSHWARIYFLATIIYLPLQLGMVLIFK